MNPYTTFSSQPRIIEAEVASLYFKSESHPCATMLFKVPDMDDCAFENSIRAKNALIRLKEQKDITKFSIEFREKRCLDEGNVLKSFTDDRKGFYNAKYDFKSCVVEVSRETIEEFISRFLNYESPDHPEPILHLVMRWNDELRDKNGAIALRFEIKCTQMEF